MTLSLLKDVACLIFDQAVSNPELSYHLAELCAAISPSIRDLDGVQSFRRALLSLCNSQFNRAISLYNRLGKKTTFRSKAEAQMCSRMLGAVKFLGNLYIVSLFPSKAIHGVLRRLYCNMTCPIPEKVEALVQLLAVVAPYFDSSDSSAVGEYIEYLELLDQGFPKYAIPKELGQLLELLHA